MEIPVNQFFLKGCSHDPTLLQLYYVNTYMEQEGIPVKCQPFAFPTVQAT